MGDELPAIRLANTLADITILGLSAFNGPCVMLETTAASSIGVKCWGPNGYGSLGLVRGRKRLLTHNPMFDETL